MRIQEEVRFKIPRVLFEKQQRTQRELGGRARIEATALFAGRFLKRKAEAYEALRLEIDALGREIKGGNSVGSSECPEEK